MKVSKNSAAILAAIIGNAIWGFSFLFTKVAQTHADPEVVLSVRFLTAFAIMNLMILTGKYKVSFKGKHLLSVLALAVIEPIYFFLESYGLFYTNSTISGVILAAVPVVSMVMAALFIKEYPSGRQAFFCFLPVAGVIIITLSGNALGIARPIGIVLLIGTCFASALYKIVNRSACIEFSSFERTYAVLCVGCVVFTIAALVKHNWSFSAYKTALHAPGFISSILFLSIFCSVACNILVNYASEFLTVVQISTYGELTTICSMFAGVIFLGEPITWISFLGSLLVLVGVWQITRPKAEKAETSKNRPVYLSGQQ